MVTGWQWHGTYFGIATRPLHGYGDESWCRHTPATNGCFHELDLLLLYGCCPKCNYAFRQQPQATITLPLFLSTARGPVRLIAWLQFVE